MGNKITKTPLSHIPYYQLKPEGFNLELKTSQTYEPITEDLSALNTFQFRVKLTCLQFPREGWLKLNHSGDEH